MKKGSARFELSSDEVHARSLYWMEPYEDVARRSMEEHKQQIMDSCLIAIENSFIFQSVSKRWSERENLGGRLLHSPLF